jgi:hypothetical protein
VGFAVLSALLDVGVIVTDVTATQRQMWALEGEQHPEVYYLACLDCLGVSRLGYTSCSCVVVSTPSVSVFDDESPSRGLNKAVCGGVRRLSGEASEGNEEKEDWAEAGVPSTIPGRCRELEPVA